MSIQQVEVERKPFHESVIDAIKKVDSLDAFEVLGKLVFKTGVPSEDGLDAILNALMSRSDKFSELGVRFFGPIHDLLSMRAATITRVQAQGEMITEDQVVAGLKPFHESVIDAIKEADSPDAIKALGELLCDTIVPADGVDEIAKFFMGRVIDFHELESEFFACVSTNLLCRELVEKIQEENGQRSPTGKGL